MDRRKNTDSNTTFVNVKPQKPCLLTNYLSNSNTTFVNVKQKIAQY